MNKLFRLFWNPKPTVSVETKLVFCINTYEASMREVGGTPANLQGYSWPLDCEGKTKEEISTLGWESFSTWFKEVPV